MLPARLSTSTLRRKSIDIISCTKQHRRTHSTLPNNKTPISRYTINRINHYNKNSKRQFGTKNESSFTRLRSNGTPELILGSTILTIAAVDYALQKRQRSERDEVVSHLQREVDRDAQLVLRQNEKWMDTNGNKNDVLFRCVVKRIPLKFDGHKCLTGVIVGDVLDVLEEGVGPGGVYNLCSVRRKDSVDVGWFPCSCLEVVKES